MFVENFRDLVVYQHAYRVSLRIHKLSLTFPKIEQFSLADQLRRASKSIGANIVEGFGKQRFSKPEFKRFLAIAIGSAEETTMWLDYAKDLGYLFKKDYDELQNEYISIINMLHKLRSGIK